MRLISRIKSRWSESLLSWSESVGLGAEESARTGKPGSESMPITLPMLRRLFPIRHLAEDELAAFQAGREAEFYESGRVLCRIGDPDRALWYLLEGRVRVTPKTGSAYELGTDDVKANFPLCANREEGVTATALTPVWMLRVSPSLMAHSALRKPREWGGDPKLPAGLRGNPLLRALRDIYPRRHLSLPVQPQVLACLQAAVGRQAEAPEIAAIALTDPAIATKLVAIANSPLFFAADGAFLNGQAAVERLGPKAIRVLLAALYRPEPEGGADPLLVRLRQRWWRDSLYRSALCWELAAQCPGTDPDRAGLAGLLSAVGGGVCLDLVAQVSRELWQEDDITLVSHWVGGTLGAFLLERWNFPKEWTVLPLRASEWTRPQRDGTLAPTDLVALAHWLAASESGADWALPSIDALPAYAKFRAVASGKSLSAVQGQARWRAEAALGMLGL